MKILAVDSDVDELSKLIMCLCHVYPESDVIPFIDPMLAVKYAHLHPVDALFTELLTQRLHGSDTARLIRKSQKNPVTVVYVTGENSTINLLSDNLIIKPVNEEKFKHLQIGGKLI